MPLQMYPKHIKSVKELADSGLKIIPNIYIRPEEERPTPCTSESAPTIDLSQEWDAVVQQVGVACEEWGCFQVVNHGIPQHVVDQLFSIGHQFHQLPSKEKMKYFTTDTTAPVLYSTSFNVSQDKVLNWRDFLRHKCSPFEEIRHLLPEIYRDAAEDYCRHMTELGRSLLQIISASLGLPEDHFTRATGKGSGIMAVNYYPRCPQPELVMGLPPHTDLGIITILSQDETSGLQILHDNKWVSIMPKSGVLIVNLGDQMRIMTNDRYKSVEHRVVVNTEKTRLSVDYNFGPSWDAVIKPACELVERDGKQVFKPCNYTAFMHKVQGASLTQKKTFFEELKTSV